MARRRKQHRKKHLSGLGAITDSKFFFPGLILAGAAIYWMTRKKDEKKNPTIEVPKLITPELRIIEAGETVTGTAQRATMAPAADMTAPPAPAAGETVSMGGEKPKTITDLVKQVQGNEIASGPAGTEMQGGGSVSADPKEQLKLMSTPDFLAKLVKSQEFKAAVMAGVPLVGDLGAEMERRFGADGRALIAQKQPSSETMMREVVFGLRGVYLKGEEEALAKQIAAYLAGGKGNDDGYYITAFYNVAVMELADRAAGRKPEPQPSARSAPAPQSASAPGNVRCIKAPCGPSAAQSGTYRNAQGVLMCRGVGRQPDRPCPTPAASPAKPTFSIMPGKPAGQMMTAPAAPPAAPKPPAGTVYAGGAAPGSKYYGKAF